jgi:hypothetical protein
VNERLSELTWALPRSAPWWVKWATTRAFASWA